MRALIALFALLFATPALAQQAPWWGGSATGTGYPTNSTPITASTTGTTAAIVATLPGVANKTTFICGFAMTSAGTTTAAAGTGTVAGTIGGTMSFAFEDPAPSAGQGRLIVLFNACIPASAMNTAIVVTQPAGGTATVAAVTAWGYQL